MVTFKIVLLLGIGFAVNGEKLPGIFQTCSRNDPKFQDCLLVSIEEAFKKLATGYPSFGMAPLEPLTLPFLYIEKGRGRINLTLRLQNIKISGITGIRIKKQKTDLKTLTSQYDAFNKKLVLQADYEVDGKILLLPIRGKGKGEIQLDDVEGIFSLRGTPYQKEGETYYDLKKLDYKFNPSKLVIKFDNLFNGDKKLSSIMNRILNNRWKEVLREVRPAFEEALSDVFKTYASNLFNRVPLDEIYPIKK